MADLVRSDPASIIRFTVYPGLVPSGDVVQCELARSAEDGLPPDLGRIRTALETVAIRASVGGHGQPRLHPAARERPRPVSAHGR
ncbi:hypothetical protein [Streptomyces cyanogenus]|uniref:hypothetical protein n=1 Tax=Streptomyces cyanogenus TaxID=80860 RepID=UPI001AA1A967|nr:hypothetical protein [Streptomyces cyanogenus]